MKNEIKKPIIPFWARVNTYFEKMPEEYKLQKTCVDWFNFSFNSKDYIIYHIKNQEKNGLVRCVNKMIGVVSGMPDLHVILPNKDFYIELKTSKGKTSAEQLLIHNKLKTLNKDVYTCNSLDSFIDIVKKNL